MIPKSKAPHLSRAHRRHPERLRAALMQTPKAMPWLLYGLMRRGGYLLGEQIEAVEGKRAPINAAPQAKPGLIAKAKSFFNRMMGR